MIRQYAADLAEQTGITLTRVSVVEGRKVGCLDVFLLHLAADGQLVSILVHQSELDELESTACCDRLEIKIRSALSRLQALLKQ